LQIYAREMSPPLQLAGLIHRNHLRIETLQGKRGRIQFLQSVLPQSMSFISHHLRLNARVCISCDSGKDLSVGIALAALQTFFDETGSFIAEDSIWASRTCLGPPTDLSRL